MVLNELTNLISFADYHNGDSLRTHHYHQYFILHNTSKVRNVLLKLESTNNNTFPVGNNNLRTINSNDDTFSTSHSSI